MTTAIEFLDAFRAIEELEEFNQPEIVEELLKHIPALKQALYDANRLIVVRDHVTAAHYTLTSSPKDPTSNWQNDLKRDLALAYYYANQKNP